MMHSMLSVVDLIMAPIWILILYFIAHASAKIKYKDQYLRKHFMRGLTVKFIGALAFVAVYGFYYEGGDTFAYFNNVLTLSDAMEQNPSSIWKILSSNKLDYFDQLGIGLQEPLRKAPGTSNYFVVKMALIFGAISLNSYVAISLLFAFASFIGVWCLYRTVTYIYPKYYKAATLPVLYIPSVFFWGSGLMKDTVVIGFIGIFIYSIYNIFFRKKRIFFNLILAFICMYVFVNVKQYVVVAFIPSLILWLSLGPINRLPKSQKFVLRPFLLIIALAVIITALPLMEKINRSYAIENVLDTAERTSSYIYRTTRDEGSSYSLGEVSYTPSGMIKVFPKAVTVSLFQPFLFQVRNPVMLFSALESTVFLFGTLYIFFKMGIRRYFRYVFQDPFLLMCLSFSIIFAFAIGISTYNFGSLVRYKIPCLPFYGLALIIPYVKFKRQKSRDHKYTRQKALYSSKYITP